MYRYSLHIHNFSSFSFLIFVDAGGGEIVGLLSGRWRAEIFVGLNGKSEMRGK